MRDTERMRAMIGVITLAAVIYPPAILIFVWSPPVIKSRPVTESKLSR